MVDALGQAVGDRLPQISEEAEARAFQRRVRQASIVLVMTHSSGKIQRGEQTVGPNLAFPRDIKRRAVIDASSNNFESQRGVDCFVECECLQRNVSLVVVHTYKGIRCFPFPRHEGGVWRQWTVDIHSELPRSLNSRAD